MKFEILSGCTYPVSVRRHDNKEIIGLAKCRPNIVSVGSNSDLPGFTDIEIEDLTFTAADGEICDHDFIIETIVFAINEGRMGSDTCFDVIKYEIMNIPPITCTVKEHTVFDNKSATILTFSGQSVQLHEFFMDVYDASDCLFQQQESYAEMQYTVQSRHILIYDHEFDVVKKHLDAYNIDTTKALS